VYQEQAVDRDLLVEARRNLTEYFQSEGYFDAVVNFEMEKTDTDTMMVVFDIERGRRYKLVHLEVTGNRYFDDETIRERMYVRPATLIRFRHGRFSQDLLERDIDAITDLYRSNGFLDVDVKAKVERDYGREEQVAVFLQIEEGPQWFVASLELSGVNPQIYEYIGSLLQSMEGQPYSELNVATDRDTILNYYYNDGFPGATLETQVTPGPQPNTVNLEIVVNEGRRQFVRDVVIGGLNATEPALVQERITLEPGDPLSQSEIIESQRRLYDLSIFAKVNTAIQNPEGIERNKYVLYEFDEASKYSIRGGIGAQIARIGGAQGLDR
jgi:outer membrane protein assembly factor BamA